MPLLQGTLCKKKKHFLELHTLVLVGNSLTKEVLGDYFPTTKASAKILVS